MTDKIKKFMDALNKKSRDYLRERISELIKNPFQKNHDIKKLQNWGKNTYRLRLGKFRVVFQVTNNKIIILAVDYRGNIY